MQGDKLKNPLLNDDSFEQHQQENLVFMEEKSNFTFKKIFLSHTEHPINQSTSWMYFFVFTFCRTGILTPLLSSFPSNLESNKKIRFAKLDNLPFKELFFLLLFKPNDIPEAPIALLSSNVLINLWKYVRLGITSSSKKNTYFDDLFNFLIPIFLCRDADLMLV